MNKKHTDIPPRTLQLGHASLIICLFISFFSSCLKNSLEEFDSVIAVTEAIRRVNFNEITMAGRLDGIIGSLDAPENSAKEYGFLYASTNSDPLLGGTEVQKIIMGTEFGQNISFDTLLQGLPIADIYNYRAYVILGERIHYGNTRSFTNGETIMVTLADTVVMTNNIAQFFGNLTFPFGFVIELSDHGFVYSAENDTPTIADTKISLADTRDEGLFIGNSFELSFNTTYQIRGYAIKDDIPFYSNLLSLRVEDGWLRVSSVAEPVDNLRPEDMLGIANGKNGYIGFGCEIGQCTDAEANARFRRMWEFDASEGLGMETLKEIANEKVVVGGRIGGVYFAIGDKIYYGLGRTDGGFKRDFWEYDPNGTGSWVQMDTFPGTPRIDGVGFSLHGKGYIGTGLSEDTKYLDDFYSFDPTAAAGKQWNLLNHQLPILFNGEETDFGRTEAIAFTIGDKAYVGTGNAQGEPFNDLWIFESEDMPWQLCGNLDLEARTDAIAFSIPSENRAFIGMGTIKNKTVYDLWEFNPDANCSANALVKKVDLPRNLEFPFTPQFAFSLNNKGYVGGPNFPFISVDIWEYTPRKID